MGAEYTYDPATGKQVPTGGPYAGGDGTYVVSGSTTYADGSHILDSGGDQRITFTDGGSLIFKDDGGLTGITLDASNNTTIAGNLEVQGNIGFYDTTPVAQSSAYTATTQNARNADTATTIGPLQDVVQTLIADLKATGIIG